MAGRQGRAGHRRRYVPSNPLGAPLDAPIRAGLLSVDALTPGHGFFDVTAGARGTLDAVEAFARGEVGWRFAPQGSAFAFGEATLSHDLGAQWQAGVGARMTW